MNLNKLVILFTLLFLGCKTEEPQNPPTVITKAASEVTLKNATLNGEVTNEGFSTASDRGFVYSEKNTNPSVSDSKLQSGNGKGIYSIIMDKLPVNTKYYFKAYATNTKGTSYGEVQSFTTADYKLPTTVTDVPKNITYTTVELGGSVTDEGGGSVSESGFVVGTNTSPTITDLKFPVAKGKASIALIVSKLNVNTKYYVRSYAINEKGIAYGNEQGFSTTDFQLTLIKTNNVSLIYEEGATLYGQVIDNGGTDLTERGFCYGQNQNPSVKDTKILIVGNNIGTYSFELNNLKSSTLYFVRAYAINSKGISYGDQVQFTTLPPIPTIISKTGRIWMDRNLGASRVATNIKDEESFGYLFQWGREADGHQLRTSVNTSTLSTNDKVGNNAFIITGMEVYSSLPNDWRKPQNDNLWQGLKGVNNVCPTGFRLPTSNEWEEEILTWASKNPDGAFASPLKLPGAGARAAGNGVIIPNMFGSYYWSSDVSNGLYSMSFSLATGSYGDIYVNRVPRGYGHSVRCIKD